MRGSTTRIAASLLVLLLLGGCGFKDIDKRLFVVATGIDNSGNPDKPYRITLRLAVTSPKIEPGAGQSQVETIEARTIAEGVRELKSYVDKELDFGQCKIFMIGEQLARTEIKPPLSWMIRRRDIQAISNVSIGYPSAEAILQIEPKTERYPGNMLFLSFGQEGTESSYTVTQLAFELGRRLTEKGLDPILPIIYPDNGSYRINQAGIFNKEKLLTILKPEETQLFNQISNTELKSSIGGNVEEDPYVLTVGSIRSTYRTNKNDQGKLVIEFNIRMKGLLEEAPKMVFNKDWSVIEHHIATQYNTSVKKLLTKFQKLGVDPIGFGLRYRATHYSGDGSSWKEWLSLYPEAEFKVNTKITVEGTGLIK
ncbi:Ger(x)C family spore germination protein [Paenibacillus sp. SYP-B4298]|uniref:Ger(x)C family spore germination protein n=1 Tax=Paenibacillus sp. SYP-B4298 TaxID=2996034 RepID=UPI0022DE6848|nr:Ger(x)C family spore germination protein [Paenibacillus sp. SYP-B4298]